MDIKLLKAYISNRSPLKESFEVYDNHRKIATYSSLEQAQDFVEKKIKSGTKWLDIEIKDTKTHDAHQRPPQGWTTRRRKAN